MTQNATGNGSGADAADCQSLAWFNTASSWGGGTNQIGAGTMVHLVGIITNSLTPVNSGSPGSPITLHFEPNARLSAPMLSNPPWINLNSLHDYVIDGGANGIIEATGAGSSGMQTCVSAINCNDASDLEVKNLTMQNLYVHTATNDIFAYPGGGVTGNGFTTNAYIHNCIFSNICWVVSLCGPGGGNEPAGQGGGNINVYSNTFWYFDHGVADLGGYSGVNIYNNTFGTTSNWDNYLDEWHHDGIHVFFGSSGSLANVNIYNNLFTGDWGVNNTANIFLQGVPGGVTPAINNLAIYNNVFTVTPNHNMNDGHICGEVGQTYILNNTFVDGNTYDIAIVSCYYQGTVANNLFSGQGVFNWYNEYGSCTNSSGAPIIAVLNNNLYTFYTTPARGLAWMFGSGWSGYSPSRWGDWQTFTGETNSIYLNTGAAGINGFGALQPGSPAMGAGANLSSLNLPGLNQDILGNQRSPTGSWDIGAYAAQSSGSVGPLPPTELRHR